MKVRVMVTILTVTFPVLSHEVFAQRETSTTSTRTSLVIARTSGETDGYVRMDVPRAAPTLTTDQLKQMITSLGITANYLSGPWKVNPADPIATGRASLVFNNVAFLQPELNQIVMQPSNGRVDLVVRSISAEKLVVTCVVSDGTYRFDAPGSSSTSKGPNLTGILDAQQAGQTVFTIRSYSTSQWNLYSCEVYKIQ